MDSSYHSALDRDSTVNFLSLSDTCALILIVASTHAVSAIKSVATKSGVALTSIRAFGIDTVSIFRRVFNRWA